MELKIFRVNLFRLIISNNLYSSNGIWAEAFTQNRFFPRLLSDEEKIAFVPARCVYTRPIFSVELLQSILLCSSFPPFILSIHFPRGTITHTQVCLKKFCRFTLFSLAYGNIQVFIRSRPRKVSASESDVPGNGSTFRPIAGHKTFVLLFSKHAERNRSLTTKDTKTFFSSLPITSTNP